jgi:hypothetical protein
MVLGANTFRQFVQLLGSITDGAAGLVDRVQVSLFPVISGRTGEDPI